MMMPRIISRMIGIVIFRWTRCFKAPDIRQLCRFFVPLVCLLIAVGVLYAFGVRVNVSSSLPCGVWQIGLADNVLHIGDSVVIDKSVISNNTKSLVKDIGAIPGDVMTREGNVVYRNGTKMPLSVIHAADSGGKGIHCIKYPVVVPEGHVWLSSRHERGYDSRYFGPVPARAVIGKAVLLWAW